MPGEVEVRMTAEQNLLVEERILQLLRHLGIEKAHLAAAWPSDWQGLVAAYPQVVSSLTVVCPTGLDPSALEAMASRVLVVHGDQGTPAETVRTALSNLPQATLITLAEYAASTAAADVIADRTEPVGAAMLDFLSAVDPGHQAGQVTTPAEPEGEVAGITYHVQGSGPALLLFPLGYAPSQWEPLLPMLSQHYCTISLGGAHLGGAAELEDMGAIPLRRVVANLVDDLQLQPGETVLDVGCGTGAHDRWLVKRTGGANRVTGIDQSPYLLREAANLAKLEGLGGAIEWREGNAEVLPFPDNSFDVTFSVLVMMFVDADRMLAEMVRVTKPGGRVGVIVWARDRGSWVNLPLREELKTLVEDQFRSAGSGGCGDASLYRRFLDAGLYQLRIFPQIAAFPNTHGPSGQRREAQLLAILDPQQAAEWRTAVAQAEAEGTFYFGWAVHCAVGTKP